jgi:putative addiction module component (TIGR02574 family)
VLTLHNLGDLFVPTRNEVEYVTRVNAHGKRDLLVQRAIRGVGHCDFTAAEFSGPSSTWWRGSRPGPSPPATTSWTRRRSRARTSDAPSPTAPIFSAPRVPDGGSTAGLVQQTGTAAVGNVPVEACTAAVDTKNPRCVEWAMSPRPRKSRRQAQLPLLPAPKGFSSLSKAEQVRYLEALWDSISARPGEIPVPESHLNLAEERLAEYRRDPGHARPARDVLDRLTDPAR